MTDDKTKPLVNSILVDAFVKAFENFQEPGDSFRSCVRHALETVAPLIAAVERERCAKIADEQVKRAEYGLILPQIDRVPLMIRRDEASIIAKEIRSVKGAVT